MSDDLPDASKTYMRRLLRSQIDGCVTALVAVEQAKTVGDLARHAAKFRDLVEQAAALEVHFGGKVYASGERDLPNVRGELLHRALAAIGALGLEIEGVDRFIQERMDDG